MVRVDVVGALWEIEPLAVDLDGEALDGNGAIGHHQIKEVGDLLRETVGELRAAHLQERTWQAIRDLSGSIHGLQSRWVLNIL